MVTGHGPVERALRLWLPVGFFLIVALFPFYWMAVTSLKPNAELYNRHMMPLLVLHPTLKHYVDLLTQTSFLLWTWNTMVVAVVSTGISLVLGVMLAYPLARMRFRGAPLLAIAVAVTYLIPQTLLFVPMAAQGKYPLIWTPNKEYTGSTVKLVAGRALSVWVANPKMSVPCTVASPLAL